MSLQSMKEFRGVGKLFTYKNYLIYSGLVITLLILPPVWFSIAQQSPQDLNKQKSIQLWKIKKNQKRLSEITIQKRNSLGELNLIRAQIIGQRKLIQVIQQEINLLDTTISHANDKILQLEDELSQLQQEYGQMIYAAAKSSTSINHLNYVFASEDFNQLYRRLRYLQQYSSARKKQVVHIQDVSEELSSQRKKAEDTKKEKETLLREKTLETQTLGSLEINKARLVKNLSSKEKLLKKELKESQKQVAYLEKMITQTVGGSSTNSNTATVTETKENIRLSKSFVSNKGRLPWPVDKGFISSRFGKQEHPLLDDVMIDNAGVDIQTSKGQNVKAVFKGKVTTIATIPGMGGQVIMIEHGKYITVYARVKDIKVSPGDVVKTQQSIGSVFTDNQGNTLLQFQVWKNSDKLNPQFWIRKRP